MQQLIATAWNFFAVIGLIAVSTSAVVVTLAMANAPKRENNP